MAVVRKENLEERNATPVGRVASANACARRRTGPPEVRELRFVVPLLAQEASYFACVGQNHKLPR
jgi:hypothetical protein